MFWVHVRAENVQIKVDINLYHRIQQIINEYLITIPMSCMILGDEFVVCW